MPGPKENPDLNPLSDDVCIHCSIPVVVENAVDVCDFHGLQLAYAHSVCADAVEQDYQAYLDAMPPYPVD